MRRPTTGGPLNSVPHKVETFEPAVRRGLVPCLVPDPLLRIETRLVRGQVPESKACVRSHKEIDLLPFMPSGPVYIQPDRKASQVATHMLQAGKKSFPVATGRPDHSPSAQKGSNPPKEIQSLAMLAGCRHPQSCSFLRPSYAQTRVERKSRFILKDNGFIRTERSEFFLSSGETAWPLRFLPEDRYSLPASVDSRAGASRTGPAAPLALSRTGASGAPRGWGRPSGPGGAQMLMEISPGPLPAASGPLSLNVPGAPAVSPAPKPVCHGCLPGASRDSNSDALCPARRRSIPDAGPPVPARAPRSSSPCVLPGFAVPCPVNALGLPLGVLPLRLDSHEQTVSCSCCIVKIFIALVLVLWTGEIILYLFSFGGHKPRWGISAIMGRSWGLELISQLSAYIGAAFWLLVLVLLRNLW